MQSKRGRLSTSVLNVCHSSAAARAYHDVHTRGSEGDRSIQIDETSYRYRKRKGSVWIIRSDRVCLILALSSRDSDDILPFAGELLDKPVAVDGYSVYRYMFRMLQRCWAHTLRDTEDVSTSNLYAPYYGYLYYSPKMICYMKEAATKYGDLKFAGILHSAANNMFTFPMHPGVHPANNNTEHDIRDVVVVKRKIRRRLVNARNRHVILVTQSFNSTCRSLRLVPWRYMGRIVDEPKYITLEDGDDVKRPARRGAKLNPSRINYA